MHLQSGEQFRFALPHLQLEQSPLQEHLTSSLRDRETSGIVIHTGTHDSDTLVQASPAEKEPLDVSVCSLSRLLLDTLPVGYAGVEPVFYAETRPPVLWTGKIQFGRVLICVWTGLDG